MMDLVQKTKHAAMYSKQKGLFTNKYELRRLS